MGENQTIVVEFILTGIVLGPRTQMLLFGLFSLFCVLTLAGERGHPGAHLLTADCTPHTLLPLTPGHRWHGLHLGTVPGCQCLWVQPSPSPFSNNAIDLSSFGVSLLTLSICSWWWCPMICRPPLSPISSVVSWGVGISLVGTSSGIFSKAGPCGLSPEAALLWASWNQPLFCEILPVLKLGLCRHLAQPSCHLFRPVFLSYWGRFSRAGLCAHPGHRPEDPVHWGPREGLPTCSSHLMHWASLSAIVSPYMAPSPATQSSRRSFPRLTVSSTPCWTRWSYTAQGSGKQEVKGAP